MKGEPGPNGKPGRAGDPVSNITNRIMHTNNYVNTTIFMFTIYNDNSNTINYHKS